MIRIEAPYKTKPQRERAYGKLVAEANTRNLKIIKLLDEKTAYEYAPYCLIAEMA